MRIRFALKLSQLLAFLAFLLTGALAMSLACSGKSDQIAVSGQGDQRLMAMGRSALENKNWTEARGYLQQLLDAYPRSQLAGDARLGIADSYFNQKGRNNLILAIADYRDFLTFFPNHPRADYAQYQIGYGHYRQIHSPDRDQEPTELAIEEFEKLVELYRNSRYAEEGRVLLEECYETLAESEFGIGLFYLEIRKHCRASIPRFQRVIDNFPTFSKMDEVHFRIGSAYDRCRQPEQALPHFRQIVDHFPESLYREEAQTMLATIPVENTDTNPGELKKPPQ